MIQERVDLYKYFSLKRKKNSLGYLNTYVPDGTLELNVKQRPVMLVCPGGGYGFLSDREKEPVAIRFLSKGYSAFTLEYSLNTPFPVPLIEACMAVVYIRENAPKYFVDPNHVCAVGFSAGGHLVGMLATMTGDDAVKKAFPSDKLELVKPDAVILSYAVITSDSRYGHLGSFNVITGGKKTLYQKLSLEKRVTNESVPAFMWHTKEDGAVPVYNALCMASAYYEHGVPFELHVFERGAHGLSLSNIETSLSENDKKCNKNVQAWVDLADNWLRSRGFKVHAK